MESLVELEYKRWDAAVASAGSIQDSERAQFFRDCLRDVRTDINTIQSMTIHDVHEVADKAEGALDDIWKQTQYDECSEEDMKKLLHAVAADLVGAVTLKLATHDAWNSDFNLTRNNFKSGINVCTSWSRSLATLTEQFWPIYPAHKWRGGAVSASNVTALSQRLEEILSIRTIHDQTVSLLSDTEQTEFDTDGMFSAFHNVNCLQLTPSETVADPTAVWESAVANYHRKCEPAEALVALKLRDAFQDLTTNAESLQLQFTKYSELIKRPKIAQGLQSEREILLSQLKEEVLKARAQLQQLPGAEAAEEGQSLTVAAVASLSMPPVVQVLTTCRQILDRLKSILKAAEAFLSDLTGYEALGNDCLELMQDVKAHEKETHQDWVKDTTEALEDEDIMLETTGRIMQFEESDGHLTVHFSDRLMVLLREVRQLRAMSYSIPAKIMTVSTSAKQFFKHAMILKQVSHFYNTIDDQILESQYLMLETHARALENLIKKPVVAASTGESIVRWSSVDQLDQFIAKLQEAAFTLTKANRQLRKIHGQFSDQVVRLMDMDLLRKESEWKDAFGRFRAQIAQLSAQGFTPEAMRPWLVHWDHQIFKALEVQYKSGLESLNSLLPELQVELVFRQQTLQFRPPIEEIRAKYYKELRKFLVRPEKVGGLVDGSIYKQIIDRNVDGFSVIYKKAEQLFQKLAKVQHQFKDWVVLGSVDIEALAERHLVNAVDWEENFKKLKVKGREAEKLPNTVKVECITVSTAPVKATIDDHIQQLVDALTITLRRSVTKHLSEVDKFVDEGTEALSKRVDTLQEIGEANQAHEKLAQRMPEIKPLFELAEAKNSLLRRVSGSSVDTNATQRRWEQFELQMDGHALNIKEQVGVMQSKVEGRADQFGASVEKFRQKWEALKPSESAMGDRDSALAAIKVIHERMEEFAELKAQGDAILEECQHFNLPMPSYEEMIAVKDSLEDMQATWHVFEQFIGQFDAFAKEEWITFRAKTHLFGDFLDEWAAKLKVGETNAVAIRIRADLDMYLKALPLLKYVRGDAFSPDHWVELYKVLGMPPTTSFETLLFADIIKHGDQLAANEAHLKDLYSRAQGEVTIRDALHEVDVWGAGATYAFTEYVTCNSATVHIIKDWKELLTKLGDNQSLLSSLKDSPYFPPFADKAALWEGKLSELDQVLDLVKTIQRKWVYLEPIFGRGALPKEQARFRNVDDDFKNIMMEAHRDGRVLCLVGRHGFVDQLQSMSDQLTRCQKSLNEFLEQKRAAFPRFYFIGDDDLLEILGQATDPTVIQTHLKKLFAGIHRVGFSEGNKQVITMISQDGEVVPLVSPVTITVQVEEWLAKLADAMVEALEQSLLQCLKVTPPNPTQFPSQILCLAEQVRFTEAVESAINRGQLTSLREALDNKLTGYTSAEVDTNDVEGRVLQLKLKALILDTIHMIEIMDLLINQRVTSTLDWNWQKHLRHYMPTRTCVIRMCDAEFDYTYEYQGNASKLVHTPLTDKCYLTLTQGMKMGFGGNPYGPAGTGKTESVKALGNAMGRQVLVFNCDEGIDVRSMGRIFIGLVKCGAWGCFDEFNRLEEAVLSAVSTQIQTIQAALKARQAEAELLGRIVDINPNSGIFITLNPAGKGYGGRQKLPDNLKQLFRPVAMSRPDLELIAEVMMYAEGFKGANDLGTKLVAVYSMAKELLSPQQHYDWGLRALKTILRGAGTLLQKRRKEYPGEPVSVNTEAFLLVQAVRVNTLSKLSFADAKRFDGLITNVFADVSIKEIEYQDLTSAISKAYEELHLVEMPTQVKKMLELHEQLTQRMGVVVVGPSGSGKSTIWRVLKRAMSLLPSCQNPIKQYVMNPKAMPRQQLLGSIDIDTREWTDGVLTAAARQVVKETLDQHSWIVCDGDVDPEWIESLNSVLDDNRLLTMPSGERIQFGPNVNFVFETHDLSCASPATISRMGMIFLSDEDTDVGSLLHAWLSKHVPDKERLVVQEYLEKHLLNALEWVLRHSTDAQVDQCRVGILFNGLSQIVDARTPKELTVGLVRGLGAALPLRVRSDFAKEMFSWTRLKLPDPQQPLDTYVSPDGSLATFRSMASSDLTLDEVLASPVVLTSNVQRMHSTLEPWMKHKHDFVLVGPEGCGKTNVLFNLFRQQRSTSIAVLHCNAQTGPSDVIQKIEQSCVAMTAAGGRVYRPREGEHLLLYVKDLNLPKPDKWNTSFIVQFLQQMIAYRGFYDSNLEWVGIQNVQIVASMNPSSTLGRHKLSNRFTSNVRILYVEYPTTAQLQEVYTSLLTPVLEECLRSAEGGSRTDAAKWTTATNVARLAGSMITIFDQVRTKFSRDSHGHYLFTPAYLTEWVTSLLRYNLQSINLLDAVADSANRRFRQLLLRTDATKFDAIVASVLRADWSHTLDGLKGKVCSTLLGGATPTSEGSQKARPYLKGSFEDYREVLEIGLKRFSREHSELGIQLFDEMLQRIANVEGVLSQPGGSLLLAGRTGCGRRSALRLAAYLLQLEIFTPYPGKSYDLKAFKLDLKQVVHTTGGENKQLVLLVEDHQLIEPSFTEVLNSLLSTGEVPGLFPQAELDTLLSSIKEEANDEGWRGSTASYLAARVKRNLHLVLNLDSSRSDFQFLCESNPAFTKECQVMWVDGWSDTSMKTLPQLLLANRLPDAVLEDAMLIPTMVDIHQSAVALGATPKDYTEFIHAYAKLYENATSDKHKEAARFKAGLDKLVDASERVDVLKAKARDQQAVLTEKQQEADKALEEITQAMSQASSQKSEAEQLRTELAAEEEKLTQRKQAIDVELSAIQPIIDEAQKAVGQIKPDSLADIRRLRAPPDIIVHILQGVLTLMGIYDTSWKSMRSFLGQRGVIDDIVSFDQRQITPEVRERVEALIAEREASFNYANAKRAFKAAGPLSRWVTANLQYAAVLEKVEPLESENNALIKNLDSSKARLEELTQDLAVIDKKVAELRQNFEKNTAEGAKLKVELDQAQVVINSAESLISKLDGERSRWGARVGTMDEEVKELPYKAMLAAAFSVYLPRAAEQVRLKSLAAWSGLVNLDTPSDAVGSNSEFNPLSFFATESEQLVWRSEGLPSDRLSLENACMLKTSSKPVFIVDPASTALTWLTTHLQDKRLEVTSQKDSNFTTSLELAVRFGKSLLVRDVRSIDPIMYPVVRGDLVAQGPRFCVHIGDKLVDYNEDFRLILVTRKPESDLPPDVRSYVTEINFTVTQAGLSGQLLARTLQHEKPDLEQRKNELLKQEEKLKLELNTLEDKLLAELADAQGNILENKTLLDSLYETKASSMVISSSLKESQELQESLSQERNAYLPLSDHASKLFFLIRDLATVDNMYQLSLSAFVRLFEHTLTQPVEGTADMRIRMLAGKLTQISYAYVARSLFKTHRTMFAMHLAHGLFPDEFPDNEWQFFVTGSSGSAANGSGGAPGASSLTKGGSDARRLPGWVPTTATAALTSLLDFDPTLSQALQLTNEAEWREWIQQPACENALPASAVRKLRRCQHLLVINALRPDRTPAAMSKLACQLLGLKDINPTLDSFQKLYRDETTPEEPILILVSAGMDPSDELRDAAAHAVGANAFHEVAMGQGQSETAVTLLRECARKGEWLCLKNLHLVTHWLPELEQELASLQAVDANFRLWLTTEPHARFSPILLQSSLKVAVESPPGIKRNLMRTYSQVDAATLKERGSLYAQALFVLAWFHAILQERRNYIPAGWSKFYEFSAADLRASMDVLQRWTAKTLGDKHIDSSTQDWGTLHGLVVNALYGGRVDNVFDGEVLQTYLRNFFNDEVMATSVRRSRAMKLAPAVVLPSSTHLPDYLKTISQLPDSDTPELFGLPANVDRTVQQQMARATLGQLRLLDHALDANTGFNREQWIALLEPFLSTWAKLVDGKKELSASHAAAAATQHRRQSTGADGSATDPIASFVSLERQSGLSTITTVTRDLDLLKQVLKGQSLLTTHVSNVAQALLRGETPMSWIKLWPSGPEVPQAWCRGVVSRVLALKAYEQAAQQQQLLLQVIDANHFFRPGTFFNALRQQTARDTGTSMDSLKFVCAWNEQTVEGTPVCCRLKGINAQGFVFDGARIGEVMSNGATLSPMCEVAVGWVPRDMRRASVSGEIEVPLYADIERQVLVSKMTLPCSANKTKWVQMGIALFLEQ
eukprot:m.50835 g.50835  ORF g.50835 m.50835 type:complete len:4155 (+) comp11193_c0_seq1:125-12589(+)